MELPPEGRDDEGAPAEPVAEGHPPPVEPEEGPAPPEEEAPIGVEVETEKDEAEELRELLVRVKADFSNYQKRVEREFAAARRSGEADVLLKFLDLLDVVERTEREADRHSDFASLRQAVAIAAKEAGKFARDSRLEKIPAVGRPFDPSVHEALMVVETDAQPEDHVVEEVRSGYIFDGKVLRHAQVVVARRPKEEE